MEFKLALQNSGQKESSFLFTWKICAAFLYLQVIVVAQNMNLLFGGSVRELWLLFTLILNTSLCPKFQGLQDLNFWSHNI